MRFDTMLLHGQGAGDKATGSTAVPIYQTSAYAHESAEKLEQIFKNKAQGFAYSRISNPTVAAFEQKINALEGGIGAVACSSGMSAVALSMLNILSAGDEIVVSSALFGGTIDLFSDLQAFGIKVRFVEHMTVEEVEPCLSEKTRAVFTELIGNPRLDITDIDALAGLVHSRNIPLIVDSTTATPYLIKPFGHGADIVVHSSSKYINGGGNSISGVIVDGGKFSWDFERYKVLAGYKRFGKFAYLASMRNGLWRNMGACLAPMNAYMNTVGLETLSLRMERQCENALSLARCIEESGLARVNYPGLESSPYNGLAKKLLGGRGGAILTLRTGSREKAFGFINALKYAFIATNIGDVRTLVIHPESTIYAHSTPEQQHSAGVYEDTVRISVGIEDIEDLKEDMIQALGSQKEV
ncbi:MAG: O-acetylhomoserine aminocarboxypropyltransferase/cysteine synthase [Ruminococcus sp.]|nr:O-acetylhomoserine aminocarboxypropyltransferase/cysteine synthase [Ruminococcus sp.]